jgi:hypothetical protein
VRNRDEKTRDMARSILPSTARSSVRIRKKTSARRARARNNAMLHRMTAFVNHFDDFEEPLDRYDLDDTGWDGVVEDRRACDKVRPLLRWAEARIERSPKLAEGDRRARLAHFAAILGDGLAGRHARSHLEHLFKDRASGG